MTWYTENGYWSIHSTPKTRACAQFNWLDKIASHCWYQWKITTFILEGKKIENPTCIPNVNMVPAGACVLCMIHKDFTSPLSVYVNAISNFVFSIAGEFLSHHFNPQSWKEYVSVWTMLRKCSYPANKKLNSAKQCEPSIWLLVGCKFNTVK